MGNRGIFACGWIVCFALVASADEAAGPRKAHTSADKKVSITLPASWRVERKKSESERMLMEFSVWVGKGESASEVGLRVARYPLDIGTPHWLHLEAARTADGWKNEVFLTPRPYAASTRKHGAGEVVELFASRVVGDRRYGLLLRSWAQLAEKLKPELFRILDSLTSKLPPRFPISDSYKKSDKNKLLWYVHKDIPRKTLKSIQDAAKVVQKRFGKVHGKRRKIDASERIRIVVTPTKSTAREIRDDIRTVRGCWTQTGSAWLFVLPFGDRADRESFVHTLTTRLFQERYRTYLPRRVVSGEAYVSICAERSGKSLPTIPQGFFQIMPSDVTPFRSVAENNFGRNASGDGVDMQAFVWVAFFHAGPSKYRKLYKEFLARLEPAGDFLGALAVFDGHDAAMNAALEKWREKLKP